MLLKATLGKKLHITDLWGIWMQMSDLISEVYIVETMSDTLL